MKVNNLYYKRYNKAQQLLQSVVAHTVTMERQCQFSTGYYHNKDFPHFVAKKLIEDMGVPYKEDRCMVVNKVFPGIKFMVEDIVTIFMAEHPEMKTIEVSDCLLYLKDEDLHRMILFGAHTIGPEDLCDMNKVRAAAELIRFILSNYDTE